MNTPVPVADALSLPALLDRIEGLVQALKLCNAAAKVRATLGTLREARETGEGVEDALERMQAQVDAMIQRDTLHLLHETVITARRLSSYRQPALVERMSDADPAA